MKIILTFLLLISAFQFCFGQEQPKAVLVDTFHKLACEDLRIHTSFFLTELSKESNSKGYAVIYEGKDGQNPSSWFEQALIGSIYVHRFKRELLQVVYGEKREHFEVEFWKVPVDAEKPKYLTESPFYKISNLTLTKPFVFGVDAEDEMVCPTFSRQIFADVLKANTNLKGRIVIFNLPKSQKKEIVENFSKLLSKDNKIPRNQYDFFFTKDRRGWYFIEFWLLPKRRKL